MSLLSAEVLFAPLLVVACSLAARKWGASAAGWLLGLPITSGPISLALFVEHGPRFAENAARGTLLGLVGASVFFATYSLSARGRRWRRSLALASALCMAATLGLSWTRLSFAGTALLAVGALALVALALATADCGNATAPTPTNDRAHEKRDLALRMAIAGAVVLTVALASSGLGSLISGMLTTVPVVSAIMVASTHRSAGSDSARGLMHGSIAGLCGGAAFFTAVGALITSAAPGVTYLVALLAAAVVSAASMKAGSPGEMHRAAEHLAVRGEGMARGQACRSAANSPAPTVPVAPRAILR